MPYLGKQSEQVGVSIQKYEFLQATDTSSGTTSFSVPSDAGDHVNVWLNGVLLVEGGSNDYTTTNTTVVFGTAPADGDIIRIDVVESFALPDALKSSGDTMTGALKLNGGIQQQTSQDLSGTYAYHQLMLSDAFTVAGDVTISDNLVLAKLSDDSNAITISNDTSTRTITGSGSLEASTLAQTPNASLTGMTGTIGSGVTFPTGHVVQVVTHSYNGAHSDTIASGSSERANISDDESNFQKQITITSGNKVLITMMGYISNSTSGDDESGGWLGLYTKQAGAYTELYGGAFGTYHNYSASTSYNYDIWNHHHISFLHTPTVTNPIYGATIWRYKATVRLRSGQSGHPLIINLMEIQQ